MHIRIDLSLFSGSCSYSLTGVRGNVTSPDYPQHYEHDLDCSWTITLSDGYYIYLHFEDFHLEDGGSHCPYDYVQIFDGSLALWGSTDPLRHIPARNHTAAIATTL